MPGYGEMSAGASRGLWRASKGDRYDVTVTYSGGSLLGQNFNGLWCGALNACHKGNPVQYFAMLHSDVEPEDGWLDVLIAELEARKLDVLGTAVPIKDPKGLTSLALDHPSGDPFRILCRLTMREVHRLPETFTSADVGHPLLLNTGCWVCRFDEAWAKRQVWFTINDRIVFNTKLGIYQAQVEPEDWNFSRQCHALGLKVGATRKVRLNHAGTHRYGNTEPWGTEAYDAAYVGESQLPAPKPDADGFRFPHDIDGWLTEEEGRALAKLARGKRVLEIGSYCGRSTVCLAQTASVVQSIDPHDGRATPSPRNTYDELLANVERYGVHDRVIANLGTVADLDGCEPYFDLIFIDGDHQTAAVRDDIEHALPLLAPGGLLAFHDYRKTPGEHDGRWDPGVTQAVGELVTTGGGELLSTHGTVAVVRPPLSKTPVLLET